LAPSLSPGQVVVVLDNLPGGERARRAVEQRGAELLFLPSLTRRTSRPSRRRSGRWRHCYGGRRPARRGRWWRRSAGRWTPSRVKTPGAGSATAATRFRLNYL